MPNWCYNRLYVSHQDPDKLDELEKAYVQPDDGKGLFNHFIPQPQDTDWYEFCVENWGTKWDVQYDDEENTLERVNDNSLILEFKTAWCPPDKFYTKLESLGYNVRAYFIDEYCNFFGMRKEGDDLYYDGGDYNIVENELDDDMKELFKEYHSDEEYQTFEEWFCAQNNIQDVSTVFGQNGGLYMPEGFDEQ